MALKRKEVKSLSMIGVIAMFFSGSVSAAIQLEHSGSVEVGTEYHSNLQFLDDNVKESVYLYNLIPEYKLTALDAKNTWSGNLGIVLQRSSNSNINGNREDPFANLAWLRTFENSLLETKASYRKQSSRNTLFSQTGVITEDGTSVSKSISADWSFDISPKWTLALLAAYEKNTFSGVSLLSDFDNRDYGSSIIYKVNEKLQPYARATFSDYRATGIVGNNRIKYQKYVGGVVVQLSPQLNLDVNTGLATFNSNGKDTWIGEAALSYEGGRYNITSVFATEVFPTGLNQVEVGDKWNTDFSYELSQKSRLGAGLALSRNDSGLNNATLKTHKLQGFYVRDLAPSWLLRADMGFSNLKFDGRKSTDDKSLGLSVIYNSPKF